MRVHIPSPLVSYTGEREVDARGNTLAELLQDLETRFPGIRFRFIDEQDALRPHMRIFINSKQVRDLCARLSPSDEVHIIQALSGG
ncbi:MAG: MoaD/ThiS family protein [Planctomycetota bacterium]